LNRKAFDTVLLAPDKARIVNRGAGTIPFACGEGDFIFARQLKR
jgi:hypothetical protein